MPVAICSATVIWVENFKDNEIRIGYNEKLFSNKSWDTINKFIRTLRADNETNI